MLKSKLLKDKIIFIKILTLITLCVIITTLIVSFTLYSNFQNFALRLVFDYSQNDLEKTGEKLLSTLSQIRMLAFNVYFDSEISKLYLYNNIEVRDISTSLNRMTFYLNTSSMLDSIYVFDADTSMFYTTTNPGVATKEEFVDKSVMNLRPEMDTAGSVPIIYRKSEARAQYTSDKMVFTYFFSERNVTRSENDAVIININEDAITNILQSKSNSIINDALYYDANKHKLVSLTNKGIEFSDRDINLLLDKKNVKGQFIVKIGNQMQMISYCKISNNSDLIFINMAPLAMITKEIDQMKTKTLVFVFLVLLVSFCFVLYFLNMIYRPISKALLKAKEMELNKNFNNYEFKNTFYQNLAWGKNEYTAQMLMEHSKDLNISIEVFGEIEAIVFKVDRYADFCMEHDINERNLYKYRFINLAKELMESIEQCEGMDMGEDIFMLVHNISPKSENRQALIEFIERVQGAIKETFSIGLTVAVSEKGLGLSSLKTLFHSAVDMIKQKMWYGNGSIFFSDSLDRKDDNTYKYPLVIEKRMEEALRLGRTADAMKNFDDLLWSAKGYSHQVYQSVITSNAVLVSRIVTQMPEGSITIHAKDSFLIIREGGTKETAEEVSQYFYQIFNEIREYANSVKQNKHNEIVEQTKKIIHEKYHDSSLCLKSIADQVELSPAYLGKIFKESTALAVLDYINSIRLEKSKLLLKETQDTIQDIMMATGFLSSGYFYTQFKKVNAMTPSEYRHGLNKQNPHKLSK